MHNYNYSKYILVNKILKQNFFENIILKVVFNNSLFFVIMIGNGMCMVSCEKGGKSFFAMSLK